MQHAAAGKFLVGTERGKVLGCNRKAKKLDDKVEKAYDGHLGPVYALQVCSHHT